MINPIVTPIELEQVKQLRFILKDMKFNPEHFGDGEDFLIRWLRENKHNVNETVNSIRKYMKHRQDHSLDTIETWEPPALIKKEFVNEFCGYATAGCPVYFTSWGRVDLKKIAEAGLSDYFITASFQLLEMAMKQAIHYPKENGKKIGPVGAIFLVDLSKIQISKLMSKAAFNLILEIIKYVNTFYAASFDHIYLCNAPFSFSLLFKLIKPMLNEQIANKLVFFSNTHALHEGLLKENIANDVIPVELGGTYLPQ